MRIIRATLLHVVLVLLSGCDRGAPPDEAKAAGKTPLDFQADSYDFFVDMDMAVGPDGKLKRLDLAIDEVKGRNTWVLWCGGNEAFWDWLGGHSYGFLDLLKLIASPDRDAAIQKRKVRFAETGLINEPGFTLSNYQDQFGLFLDTVKDPVTATPKKEVYGRSSGVVGLRLFKNPKFDHAASLRWDANRYFNDAKYYNDPELVRPYRVGMSCGFCHVAPHPLNPPKDPAEPEWANLSSNIGNQYWNARTIFGGLLKRDNFIYHVLDAQPRGTIDTSLIASDNINNPNTINAIFEVPGRLDRSGLDWRGDKEWKAANEAWFAKFNTTAKGSTNLQEAALPTSKTMPVLLEWPPYEKLTGSKTRPVPRILLEGADSVGAWGALARVYLNIGTYHEQWIRLQNPVVGFKKQEPFLIEDCDKQSVYWQANKSNVEYLAKFFVKSTAAMRLKDAPGGKQYLRFFRVSCG